MIKNNIKAAASLLLLAGALTLGCNSGDHKNASASTDSTAMDTAKDSSASVMKETPLKGCYLSVIKKDTFQLAITAVNGKSVEGSLILNFAEKDRSRGTFAGEYNAGILLGMYTFKSEGTTSQRQVTFKKVAGGFIEGYGEMTTAGDKQVFAKPGEVKFDQDNVYKYTENCID